MNPVLNKLEGHLKDKIVFLGIGNSLRGDDAFGSMLAKRIGQKVAFKVFDAGTAPENFLGSVIKEKPDTVLFVDAVDFGGEAGDLKLLDSEAVMTGNLFATHNISMSMLFSFIAGSIKADAYLLAVQPKDIGLAKEMSPEVTGRLKELEDWFVKRYRDDKQDS